MTEAERIQELEYHLESLLNNVARVTCLNGHVTDILDRDLIDLSNKQLYVEKVLRNKP